MKQKKCFKDIYAPIKWTLFAALTAQLLFGGFMTIGIYADWMYVVLPLTVAALLAAARFGWDRHAVRITVRIVCALPLAFSLLMMALQSAVSAAAGWPLSFETILWDAVRSSMPMLFWFLPVYGVAARARARYDRVLLCVAQGWLTALIAVTVWLTYIPNSGIIADNGWGIPHIAAFYALLGVAAATTVITLLYARNRRQPTMDDGEGDTFGGLLNELKK